MSEFKPVPWMRIMNRVVTVDERREVAVATKADPKMRGHAEQTAQFISAAPALYEALTDLRAGCAAMGWDTTKMDAALKQANGEQL